MAAIKKLFVVLLSVLLVNLSLPVKASENTYNTVNNTLCDIDGNGKINAYDACLLLMYLSESVNLSDAQLAACDADSDGKVSPYDGLYILEVAAEKIKLDTVETDFFAEGIDVSKYQGDIDWQAVKDSGIKFAILRAGYGKYTSQKDPYFEQNYNVCKSLGIPVGAYIFSYADTVEAAEQEADVMLEWIDGKSFEYPIYYDVESNTELGVALTSQITEAFCETLENNGYYTGVYSYQYYLNTYISSDTLKKYSIWAANTSSKPSLTYGGTYSMWQYSHTGTVNGISGNVDLDYCYKDFPSIMKKYNLNGF